MMLLFKLFLRCLSRCLLNAAFIFFLPPLDPLWMLMHALCFACKLSNFNQFSVSKNLHAHLASKSYTTMIYNGWHFGIHMIRSLKSTIAGSRALWRLVQSAHHICVLILAPNFTYHNHHSHFRVAMHVCLLTKRCIVLCRQIVYRLCTWPPKLEKLERS